MSSNDGESETESDDSEEMLELNVDPAHDDADFDPYR